MHDLSCAGNSMGNLSVIVTFVYSEFKKKNKGSVILIMYVNFSHQRILYHNRTTIELYFAILKWSKLILD